MDYEKYISEFEDLEKQYADIKDKTKFVLGTKSEELISFYEKLLNFSKTEINEVKKLEEKMDSFKSEMPLLQDEKEKLLGEINDVDLKLNSIMKSL